MTGHDHERTGVSADDVAIPCSTTLVLRMQILEFGRILGFGPDR